MTYDYAVIGGGVSGIATSLLLAGLGFRVALIEQSSRTAGVIRGFSRRGVQFDTGFHYGGALGDGEALDVFFRYLGLSDRLEKESLDPEGFDTVRCRYPDFEFRFPLGTESLRARLHGTFPGERRAIDGYLDRVEQVCSVSPYLNLDADFLNLSGQGPRQGETLQEVLDGLTGNSSLKGILSVHALLYGSFPHEAPFDLHALVAGPYYRSAHTFKGGGRSLAEAFDRELARRGVDVFCGQGAERIVLGSDARPCGVQLSGGDIIACKGCISTIHPRMLLDLLPEGAFRPAYRKRLLALDETPSAFLFFGLSSGEETKRLRNGNLFLLETSDALTRLEGTTPDDAPIYVTSARGEEGDSEGYMAILPISRKLTDPWRDSHIGNRPPAYRAFKEETVQRVQKRLSLFCPGLQESTSWHEASSPLTLRDYAHSPFGSLYGVKHRVDQINPQAATRVSGLWLAGQAVAAPGVMGAMTSAFLACGQIVGHERIRKELKEC